MNYYTVGYGSYEESPDIVLTCEKLYTEEEFRELCSSITADLFLNRRQLFKDRYQFEKEDNSIIEDYDPMGSFQYLYEHVVNKLISDHNFNKLKFQAYFSPFGWANFIPKDDWGGEVKNDKDLESIRNKV